MIFKPKKGYPLWSEIYSIGEFPILEHLIKNLKRDQLKIEISDKSTWFYMLAAKNFIDYESALAKGHKEAAKLFLSITGNYVRKYKKEVKLDIKRVQNGNKSM